MRLAYLQSIQNINVMMERTPIQNDHAITITSPYTIRNALYCHLKPDNCTEDKYDYEEYDKHYDYLPVSSAFFSFFPNHFAHVSVNHNLKQIIPSRIAITISATFPPILNGKIIIASTSQHQANG